MYLYWSLALEFSFKLQDSPTMNKSWNFIIQLDLNYSIFCLNFKQRQSRPVTERSRKMTMEFM